jgi:hypothetical protein
LRDGYFVALARPIRTHSFEKLKSHNGNFAVNDRMGLSLIAEVMGWPNDQAQATEEYAWLRMMSSVKYDGYSFFRAGIRFVETLATWLKQFEHADRTAAYDFVKKRLVYFSLPEIQCLVDNFIPEVVTPNLREVVAANLGVKPYEVWKDSKSAEAFYRRLRKVLFVGLSDGSRIDLLRRSNFSRISQEQVVPSINVDIEKWRDLNENLVKHNGMGPDEKFEDVYLVDDFTASGTTFIRQIDGKWKGKLKKFNDIVVDARGELGKEFPIADGYTLHIHHYISSHQARRNLNEKLETTARDWKEKSFGRYSITEGLILPETLPLSPSGDAVALSLCDKYYDHALFKRLEKHCREADMDTMKLGYAYCALPVVLEHNTPNNSIPLLWAETTGSDGAHAMQPLFFRRDRHGQ